MKKTLTRVLSLVMVFMLLLSLAPATMAANLTAITDAASKSTGTDIAGMLALKQYVFVKSENEVLAETTQGEGGGAGDPGAGEGQGMGGQGMGGGSATYYVTTDYYGVYMGSTAETQAAFVPVEFDGITAANAIMVYADKACSVPADGVTAEVKDGKLTVKGVSSEENVVYYLSIDLTAYPTAIYVVNDEYVAGDKAAKLTLADGTSIDLTTYAPNLANGDYTATEASANKSGSVFIGANKTLVSAADYGITDEDDAAAVNWYLQSGITNAGDSLTEFGDNLYVFEYAVAMYRMFQLVVDVMPFHSTFVDAADYKGGQGGNDSFSDALSATMQAGVWNGIFTQYATSDGTTAICGASTGLSTLPLLTNITDDGLVPSGTNPVSDPTYYLGTGNVLDIERAYVALYNAIESRYGTTFGSNLATSLKNAAAAYDEETKTAPEDYTNVAKIYAVAKVIMGLDVTATATGGDAGLKAALGTLYGTTVNDYSEKLTKIQSITLLYKAACANSTDGTTPYLGSKDAPTTEWATNINVAAAGMEQYIDDDNPTVSTKDTYANGENVIVAHGTAVAAINKNLNFVNSTISSTGGIANASQTIAKSQDANTGIDGAAVAMGYAFEGLDQTKGGVVYNATARNAYYRGGLGAGFILWNSNVTMTSNDGTLAIDAEGKGEGGSNNMAGGAYVGYGSSMLFKNANTYSADQHLTNLLYNGTVHYLDSYEVASGRAYSSDFWGGYQVYEDSVVSANGNFIDEPTSLVVKNSYYDASLGGTGFGSLYVENSVVNCSGITFNNNTSGITDTASATFVNSTVNSASTGSFMGSAKGDRAVFTLVDSDINLTGGNVLAKVTNNAAVTNIDKSVEGNEATKAAYQARFNGQLTLKLYGTNTIETVDGKLTVDIPEGSKLTIYGNVVDLLGNPFQIEGGNVEVISGEEYGTLVVRSLQTFIDKTGKEVVYGAAPDATIVVTKLITEENIGSWSGLSGEDLPYRAALYVNNGAIEKDLSVMEDKFDSGSADKDLVLSTETSGFSALIVKDSDYDLSHASINMNTKSDGTDVNDFAGYGAAVSVYGNSNVTVTDSTIQTVGVAKAATFVDDGANLIVKRSVLTSKSGTIYAGYYSTADQSVMINPPWVLGISGSARTTNVMGVGTTATYIDTDITANDWGAVSVDTGNHMHITAVNTDITVKNSGYGAYAIGDTTIEDYYGTDFDVNTYAIIMTGAEANLRSYTGGEGITVRKVVDDQALSTGFSATGAEVCTATSSTVPVGEVVPTTVKSDNFGFMFHANGSTNKNYLNIMDGTEIETGKATFLIKKVNNQIRIDNAEITSGNGVILQMIDNDDDMVGVMMPAPDGFGMPTFNTTFTEEAGWSSEWANAGKSSSGWQNSLTVTNTALEGDIYNGTGYTSNGAADLDVLLGTGATLNGNISLTAYQHDYKTFTYRNDSYDAETAATAAGKLGHVTNTSYDNGKATIDVTITGNAVWTVGMDETGTYKDAADANAKAQATLITNTISTLTLDKPENIAGTDRTIHTGALTIDGVSYNKGTYSINGVRVLVAGGASTAGSSLGSVVASDTVDAAASKNGTFVISNLTPEKNEEITITATPNEGYEVASVTVTDKNGKAVEVTGKDNVYTFTYPNKAVTVEVTFVPSTTGMPFNDVAEGDWYFDAVEYAYENGLFSGVSDTKFQPNAEMTRAMLVTVLYRAAGSPAVTGTNGYSDVEAGQWYTDAVIWASANGIVNGVGDDAFAPNSNITREQLAAILWRYAKATGVDVSVGEDTNILSYDDAIGGVSDWAMSAMQWACGAGIINGIDNNLVARGTATRAQVATVFMRYLEK